MVETVSRHDWWDGGAFRLLGEVDGEKVCGREQERRDVVCGVWISLRTWICNSNSYGPCGASREVTQTSIEFTESPSK